MPIICSTYSVSFHLNFFPLSYSDFMYFTLISKTMIVPIICNIHTFFFYFSFFSPSFQFARESVSSADSSQIHLSSTSRTLPLCLLTHISQPCMWGTIVASHKTTSKEYIVSLRSATRTVKFGVWERRDVVKCTWLGVVLYMMLSLAQCSLMDYCGKMTDVFVINVLYVPIP